MTKKKHDARVEETYAALKEAYAETERARIVLRQAFASFWRDLGEFEKDLVIADLVGLAKEEFADDYNAAVVEFRRRLGGPINLKSYAACLVAGEMRNKRNAVRVRAQDVSVTVGNETIECATMINEERVRMRYSGYTKQEAVRQFLFDVNTGKVGAE